MCLQEQVLREKRGTDSGNIREDPHFLFVRFLQKIEQFVHKVASLKSKVFLKSHGTALVRKKNESRIIVEAGEDDLGEGIQREIYKKMMRDLKISEKV